MFTLEITVNHSDGDRVSYNSPYKMPMQCLTLDIALAYQSSFTSWYKDLKEKGKTRELGVYFTMPQSSGRELVIDGIYDRLISTKIVLIEDFKQSI